MKTMTIRGVPMAMQRDGWWLNAPPPPGGPPPLARAAGPDAVRLGLLMALIALGDVLIWQVAPGLSLAAFGALLVLGAICIAGRTLSGQHLALIAGSAVMALLPLVELVQPLSLLMALSGVSVVLAFIAGLRPSEVLRGALRLWPLGVAKTVEDSHAALTGGGTRFAPGAIGRMFLSWFMPLGMAGAFALLLLAANPIAEQWLGQLEFEPPHPGRFIFWLMLGVLIWPVLCLPWMRERLRAQSPARVERFGPPRQGLINPASVLRALVLFNALFAVQTVMDIVFLYGGVGLPEGVTYASYAHRGAYPLLVTALLAGGMALMTRRWTDGSVMLRALLMIWVAQNVALVVSSLYRLELYIEAYGLTRLRMSAAIWMALVAIGLALILWQVWKRRSNGWLAGRGGLLAAGTLYLCCFVSFDAVIARYNINNSQRLDHWYLCGLGDAAKPIIEQASRDGRFGICPDYDLVVSAPQDWREWGFRNARARRSLLAVYSEPIQ